MAEKIVFATGNKDKLREAAEILGAGYKLVSPADCGLVEDIPETGKTIHANSTQKASYIWKKLGVNCFADDTGLEVDVLGGAPGVHSARYAGEGHDSLANVSKLLNDMAEARQEAIFAEAFGITVREVARKARFHTVVTLVIGGKKHWFEGFVEGRIAISPKGDGGFGYDPVFIPDEIPCKGGLTPNEAGLTFAELPEEDKNAISHRGKAMRAMAEWMKANLPK